MSKTYRVERQNNGEIYAWSYPTGTYLPGDNLPAMIPQGPSMRLPHVVIHNSPGFETGYAGEGPADLALSILSHHFHETPEEIRNEWFHYRFSDDRPHSKALALHQDFKLAFICTRPLERGGHYDITSEEIDLWIQSGKVVKMATAVITILNNIQRACQSILETLDKFRKREEGPTT